MPSPTTPLLSLAASNVRQRTVVLNDGIVILNDGQSLEDLEMWPGDEVWSGTRCFASAVTWGYLGRVNSEGVFVAFMGSLS